MYGQHLLSTIFSISTVCRVDVKQRHYTEVNTSCRVEELAALCFTTWPIWTTHRETTHRNSQMHIARAYDVMPGCYLRELSPNTWTANLWDPDRYTGVYVAIRRIIGVHISISMQDDFRAGDDQHSRWEIRVASGPLAAVVAYIGRQSLRVVKRRDADPRPSRPLARILLHSTQIASLCFLLQCVRLFAAIRRRVLSLLCHSVGI